MIKIAIFSDLHYKKRMYTPQVAHLKQILDRAAENNVDFFCTAEISATIMQAHPSL